MLKMTENVMNQEKKEMDRKLIVLGIKNQMIKKKNKMKMMVFEKLKKQKKFDKN